MRLKKVGIKNFRGFKNETTIPIDPDITGITGRNDVGKSSVLEVLDIFFEGVRGAWLAAASLDIYELA